MDQAIRVRPMQNLIDSVLNRHSGKKYSVSTVRKFPLDVWETAIIRSGFLSGFSTKNFLFVEETVGELPDAITDAHTRAVAMASAQPVEHWQMTVEEIRKCQTDAANMIGNHVDQAAVHDEESHIRRDLVAHKMVLQIDDLTEGFATSTTYAHWIEQAYPHEKDQREGYGFVAKSSSAFSRSADKVRLVSSAEVFDVEAKCKSRRAVFWIFMMEKVHNDGYASEKAPRQLGEDAAIFSFRDAGQVAIWVQMRLSTVHGLLQWYGPASSDVQAPIDLAIKQYRRIAEALNQPPS